MEFAVPDLTLVDARREDSHEAGDSLVRRAVRALDLFLRRRHRIFEHTSDPECLVRLAVVPCAGDVVLADGTRLQRGAPILELHLWNEHVPLIPPGGATIAWAIEINRRVHRSLTELAAYIARERELAEIMAIRGQLACVHRAESNTIFRVAARYGFEAAEQDRPAGPLRVLHDLFENLLLWALIWTYNPGGLRGKGLIRRRHQLWISRRALTERYGAEPVLEAEPSKLRAGA